MCSTICMLTVGGALLMPPLTPGELKLMRLLWEHGEMKPADLQGRFSEPIKNPALRFYLTTLLEKGHVTRRKAGRRTITSRRRDRARHSVRCLGNLSTPIAAA